jgi:hypothetical protein
MYLLRKAENYILKFGDPEDCNPLYGPMIGEVFGRKGRNLTPA